MQKYAKFIFWLIAVCLWQDSQSASAAKNASGRLPKEIQITVKNNSPLARTDALITIDLQKIKKVDFTNQAFEILSTGKELALQTYDDNQDGRAEQILSVADFAPFETKILVLRTTTSGIQPQPYTKRTQAELAHKIGGKFVEHKYAGGVFQNVPSLRVPAEHTDHSTFIRYEGPGWESDKVGYRFYLDWRNAIDIFGKKTTAMVLQNVGLDGFESYHQMSDWGMDILKVGESLGIGTLAMWQDGQAHRIAKTDSVVCTITANGVVFSQIRTKYFGWKMASSSYNVVSDLSITAGSRLTKQAVTISAAPQNLCTGIVKLENTQTISAVATDSGWVYFATYGKQSLADDNLGMAILYQKNNLIELTEDSLSHVVVLKPQNGRLTYYFLAAWEQELAGIKTAAAFRDYLNQTVAELNSPLIIKY